MLADAFVSRLLTEDPQQRLGARGASEVILILHTAWLSWLSLISSSGRLGLILIWVLFGTKILIQVKQHPFFRDINWDTLARQKVCCLCHKFRFWLSEEIENIFQFLWPLERHFGVQDSADRKGNKNKERDVNNWSILIRRMLTDVLGVR